jgi:ribosomal protein S18 acetylase RimI-like enzyme
MNIALLELKANNYSATILNFSHRMALSDPWLTMGITQPECLKSFQGIGKEIYVAELNNTLAGFVILQLEGTFKGYIQTLYVDVNFRNQGIGKKLIKWSEERILKFSPNIFICVSSFNTHALKLYTEFGFNLVGTLDDFVKEGFNELLLRKTIGPIVGYTNSSTKV